MNGVRLEVVKVVLIKIQVSWADAVWVQLIVSVLGDYREDGRQQFPPKYR
jgi:hypothetical protein